MKDYCKLTEADCILQKTPYTFDVSVCELLLGFLVGSKLVFAKPEGHKDPYYMRELIHQKGVTLIQFVPSMLKAFLLSNSNGNLPNLKRVITSGEALSLSLKDMFFEEFPHVDLYNLYGPTEASIEVTFWDCLSNNHPGIVPIGKPIWNTSIYIFDELLQPVPIGVPGELYIGGEGLARGYLNRSELTAERFIENPFQTEEEKALGKNGRLYKTGDLCRWLEDGNIDYIGRLDDQVKIRGFRIEVGEIEAALLQHPQVKEAVVVDREDTSGDKRLVGYLVSKSNSDKGNDPAIIEVAEIRVHLQNILPDYMIPSALVVLNTIPLTANGKIDRKSLPAPEYQGDEKAYVVPRTETEKALCEIWQNVLKVEKVGIHDNFFRLGGHSLLATQVISYIRARINIDLPLKALFESPTIAGVASIINSFSQTATEAIPDIVAVNQPDSLPLSFAQERLWFIERYAEGTNAYNIPGVFKISDNVKLDVLELSIKAIISRHEVLRTLIREDDTGNGYQFIMDDKEYPLEVAKIVVENHAQLDQELEKQANHIFDLKSEYPIQVSFCEINNNVKNSECYLSIVIHHIAFDGWSIDIFLRELLLFYNYYLDQSQGLKANLEIPTLSIQYKDFALWQRKYLTKERLDNQLDYWKSKLNDYKTLNLITDKPRPNIVNYEGGYIYFELDDITSEALRELARELEISLYSLLLAGYYLMLRVYSNQDDIVIGTPVANRHYSQVENLIGFFVNSLALRAKIDPGLFIIDFIKQVWNEVVEAQLYQDLPFEKLVEELEVEKDTSRHPVFQVQFGVQSFGSAVQNQASALTNLTNLLQPYIIEGKLYRVAQFDVITFMDDSQNQLTGSFNYAISLYNEATVTGFMKTYTTILKQIAELANNKQKQESAKISSLNYLGEEEYNQVINVWNHTDKPYPNNQTIQALFEEQVEKTPDNIAVTYNGIKLTYQQLNEKANQLANYLKQSYKIEPETLVALCLDRNENMLISILAILKAGGGYVPIDPSYPDERIQYILTDADIKLVLTNAVYKQKLESIGNKNKGNLISDKINIHIELLAIDDDKIRNQLKTQPITSPATIAISDNIAYVIYTSGTTGNPKGILMSHKVLVKLITWEKNYSFSHSIKVAQFASISFDVSLQEITYALLNGHELVIIPEDIKLSFHELVHFIDKQQINRLYFPSTALSVLAEKITHEEVTLKDLTTIIVSGEELIITSYITVCFKQRPWLELINHYGPSETHLVSSYNLPRSVDEWLTSPSIGKPIDNTKFYILDSSLMPLPIGAAGELYIGGEGLAKGYLNRPEITSERFIDNPFQNEVEKLQNKNARIYKSGDLVKWSPEGNLQYIGRNDDQVKIRGYRIELGEIENVLLTYEGIKQCAVVVKEHVTTNKISSSGNKYLVCYYVADSKINENNILIYLQSNLPEYMVPHVLIYIEKLPLTINGKLDTKALPEPELKNQDNYIPPRNELEKKACQIWANVLGLSEDIIGVRDDFFKLGGNSILAIRLVSLINKDYQSHLKISDIFIHRNIESLLPRIAQSKDNYQTIVKLNHTDDKPNMFMIHPGEAGCEVYTSLGHRLSNSFSCYGVDSYNLYHENKINNLHDLSNYYLSYIDKIMTETKQDTYHLLGWSLGGVLSLEIACTLEQRGNSKVKVYLLDAILEDVHLSSLMDTIDFEKVKDAYKSYKFSRGYEESYIEKIVSLVSVEKYLIRIDQISSTLNKTKVLLFKAMLQDTNDISFQTPKSNEIHTHISNLEYNNVDKIIKNKTNMKLIKINDAYHKNILEKEELITLEINCWNKKSARDKG